MRKRDIFICASLFLLTSCGSVPLTGRKQLLLVSDSEVLSSSLTQYNDYIKTAKKSTSTSQTAMVKRVGQNIASATEEYLRQAGMSDEIKNFSWEFNLVADKQVNASDDELAVVIGHEVAHAVAKHSNERMSQQIAAQYGSQILSAALSEKNAIVKNVAGTVYGLGAQYGVMLPFSRTHELEADYMGLILMTMAGYNPEVSVNFWQKMSAQSGGGVPEFMSTHPSDEHRINEIKKVLPELKKYIK